MTNKVYAKLPKHHITKYIVMFVQLTLSRHWCSRGRAQQQEDLRLPLCSCERACRAQRPAPMTTNCTPGFCRRTCDTLRHLQSLWSRGNIPWMKRKLNCSRHFLCKSIYYYMYNIMTKSRTIFTYLALTKHIALPCLRDVHLPVLYLRNLYWERKFQGFWKLTLLKSGSHQNLPHCHKRDSGAGMSLWKLDWSSWWIGPRRTDDQVLLHILFLYAFIC